MAEARLAGLDQAVVSGSYLGTGAGLTKWDVPLLATTRPLMDQREEVVVNRLPTAAAELVAGGASAAKVRDYLDGQRGTPVKKVTVQPQAFYEDLLDTWTDQGSGLQSGMFAPLTRYWTAGPVTYERDANGALAPKQVTNDPKVWQDDEWPGGAPSARPTPSSAS
ncbi:hypothetical protein ACFQYP_55775 [Nonomuraea antimicrobica]